MKSTVVRRVTIGAAALLALLLVAAFVFTATFDVNRYKSQIAGAVQQRTGRTLRFDGDLALSVFPRLAVKLPATTLSEPGRDTVFARLRSAQASVALLPLLRRKLQVDAVRIDGLQATVERRKDGTTNIDDLLGRDKVAPTGKAEPGSSPAGAIVGAVELRQADVTWRDLAAGRTVRLTEFDLVAGRFAPGARMPLEASAAVTASEPVLAARVKFEAEVDWSEQGTLRAVRDLALRGEGTLRQQAVTIDAKAGQLVATADALDVRGLTVAASARGEGGTPLELRILAPRLEAGKARARGERIELSFLRRGSEPLEAKVLIDGVGGTAARLEAQSVKISGSARSARRATRFEMAASLVASVDDETLRIDRATGEIVVEDAALGPKPVRLPLNASGGIDARRQTVALQFESQAEGLSARGRIDATGFAAPSVAFELDADQLDADRYLLGASPQQTAAGDAGKQTPPTPARPAADAKAGDANVDLSALRAFNATGSLRVARLRLHGTDIADMKAGVKVNDGRLDIAPFTLRVHGGSVSGRVGLDARGNRLAANGAVSGIQLRRLAGNVGGRAAMEGSANGTFDLATAGASVNQMKRALGGTLAFEVRDGALVGIDLADLIGTASGFLQSKGRQTGALDENKRTPFSRLSASVRIKDGVATNDDLKATSPQLDIAGSGRMDVVSTELDYNLRAQVLPGPATEGGPLRSFAGITVPVKISGPIERPRYGVDWAPIAAEMLLRRATGRTGTPSVNQLMEGLGDLLRRKK
jgi:AsmA protein